nr:MAG TPA: hypothetical protein [Caudoviricetes sp.]
MLFPLSYIPIYTPHVRERVFSMFIFLLSML